MSSKKWMPWDFYKSHSKVFCDSRDITCMFFEDPIVEKLVVDGLILESKKQFKKVFPEDLSRDWISSNIQSLDMFATSEEFIFLFCDRVQKGILNDLIEALSSQGKTSFLVFSKPDKDVLKKYRNNINQSFHIANPAFWDFDKLLNFFSSMLDIKMSYDLQNYLLNSIENNSISFYTALNALKCNFGSREISTQDASTILINDKFDKFHLASTFGAKNIKLFYAELLKLSRDYDLLEEALRFMESHVSKLYQPSYVDAKPRPSKYDKQVVTHSKLWKKNELVAHISKFQQLLYLAKKKDPNVKNVLLGLSS